MAHFVYFITDGEFIKIGISKSIQERLLNLQTSNAKPLFLLRSIECDSSKYASNLERALHKHFQESRLCGEWFRLNWQEIEPTLDSIKPFLSDQDRELERRKIEPRGYYPVSDERPFTRKTESEIAQIRFDILIEADLVDNYPPMNHFPNLGTDVVRPRRFMPKQWKFLRDN